MVTKFLFKRNFPIPSNIAQRDMCMSDLVRIVIHQCTQLCRFLSQEVREKRGALVAPPRAFPLSVWATFRRKFWIITNKFTQLSTSHIICLSTEHPACKSHGFVQQKFLFTSGKALHPIAFATRVCILFNQKLTLYPRWPYISGPYKRDLLYPLTQPEMP